MKKAIIEKVNDILDFSLSEEPRGLPKQKGTKKKNKKKNRKK